MAPFLMLNCQEPVTGFLHQVFSMLMGAVIFLNKTVYAVDMGVVSLCTRPPPYATSGRMSNELT